MEITRILAVVLAPPRTNPKDAVIRSHISSHPNLELSTLPAWDTSGAAVVSAFGLTVLFVEYGTVVDPILCTLLVLIERGEQSGIIFM